VLVSSRQLTAQGKAMLQGYPAKYTRFPCGYMGQFLEWPEVVTEGADIGAWGLFLPFAQTSCRYCQHERATSCHYPRDGVCNPVPNVSTLVTMTHRLNVPDGAKAPSGAVLSICGGRPARRGLLAGLNQ
jgi:hypothetical protein